VAASLLPNRWMLAACDIVGVVGIVLVGLSSTPLPPALRILWILSAPAALIVAHAAFAGRRARYVMAGLVALACTASVAWEAPHHLRPHPPQGPYPRLYVFGDSITAGVGREQGPRWTEILRRRHRGVEVVDLAIAGATIETMVRVANERPLGEGLVLVEIGGNDMFRRASVEAFYENLDALLTRVSGRGRAVVMFELPLFPFHGEIARAQRELARRHGVTLIPKRYFAGVLAGEDATIDGLHLSDVGHERMAAVVESLLWPSLSAP
jgi:acyl-CoA thioesterase-1